MKFFFTFRKSASAPNEKHFVIVNAPCEDTAVRSVLVKGWSNWSSISTSRRMTRGLKLWREI